MAAKPRRSPTPVLGQFALAALTLAMLGAVALLPASRAAFVDTTTNGPNSAAADACFPSATVQSGTATNSASGTQTVTISSVDPAKAFLIFSTRHNSNRPVGSVLGGQIASATTIEFHRNTNEGPPSDIDIQWYVVEYACGVNVQRGSVSQSSTAVNVAISAVAATDQAFVTYSKSAATTDTTWGSNEWVLADLTSTTNLQFRSNQANSAHTIYWQVVEFTDPSRISVQRGTTTIPTASNSTTVTLPTSVDTTASFVLVSIRTDVSNTYIDETMLRSRLLSSTSLQLSRGFADNGPTEIGWQVIELNDRSTVQHGQATMSGGDGSDTVTISSVDLGRATAFSGSQNGGGQNGGLQSYFDDDIIGDGSATFGFASSTQLSIQRNSTQDTGSFGWQVVEWGN